MANLKQLKENNQNIYPITHEDAVMDNNGVSISTKLASHGNHVPTVETANNAKFLRNDNTWQAVTPANIGASATSHNHNTSYYTKTEVDDKLTTITDAEIDTIIANALK